VRVEASRGTLRFYRREDGDKWKKYHSVRLSELKEQNEYEPLGASDQPGKFYVLARPEGAQRRGVYLYDLTNESFGPPIAENPEFDITSAFISRDGTRVQRYCYLAHVRICESADAMINAHMKGVRKLFQGLRERLRRRRLRGQPDAACCNVEGPSESARRTTAINWASTRSNSSAWNRIPWRTNKCRPRSWCNTRRATASNFPRTSRARRARTARSAAAYHDAARRPEARDHLTFDL